MAVAKERSTSAKGRANLVMASLRKETDFLVRARSTFGFTRMNSVRVGNMVGWLLRYLRRSLVERKKATPVKEWPRELPR